MDGFHRGDEKLEGFSEVSRLEGAGAFLSERHIVGHDGGPEDVISREGEKLGHPAASAPEFQESGAGGEAEGLEGLEESSKFPAVLRPRLGSPEGFPSVGVEVGLLGSAGHGVVKTDLGLVGSGLVVEGGGRGRPRNLGGWRSHRPGVCRASTTGGCSFVDWPGRDVCRARGGRIPRADAQIGGRAFWGVASAQEVVRSFEAATVGKTRSACHVEPCRGRAGAIRFAGWNRPGRE